MAGILHIRAAARDPSPSFGMTAAMRRCGRAPALLGILVCAKMKIDKRLGFVVPARDNPKSVIPNEGEESAKRNACGKNAYLLERI